MSHPFLRPLGVNLANHFVNNLPFGLGILTARSTTRSFLRVSFFALLKEPIMFAITYFNCPYFLQQRDNPDHNETQVLVVEPGALN